MKATYIYKVRYEGGYEEAFATKKEALAEYNSKEDWEGYWHAVELYRLDCTQGLVKTLRGKAYYL